LSEKIFEEVSMKQKKGKKLRLGKETIQDLETVLDKDDQKRIKGGYENDYLVNTQIRVFC
jgi:hypothetical protein